MKKTFLLLLILFSGFVYASAQCCTRVDSSIFAQALLNTYYPVQGSVTLPAGATSISLAAVPPNDPFGNSYGTVAITTGDLLMIIQMQGAPINNQNSNLYGAGSATSGPDGLGGTGYTSLNGVGNYELIIALNDVPLSGGVLQFTACLTPGLLNTYVNQDGTSSQPQMKFQIIRVPQFRNLTLSANITTTAWNGSAGGVIALAISDTLNMNGFAINAAGKGFRGGYQNVRPSGNNLTVYTTNDNTQSSGKGEGISGTPRFMWDGLNQVDNGIAWPGYYGDNYGRGAAGNAGGGGNTHNSGGGGGGNGGAGGVGANGVSGFGTAAYPNGGRPGSDVPSVVTRMIMGGGGGGGDANDALTGVKGGGGGGIVFIRAGAITGTGSINVNAANGLSGAVGANPDGAGGGGAGGTILIQTTGVNNPATLTLTATGGSGGNTQNDNGDPHGPGGGGGGGSILYNAPGAGITTNVQGGTNGLTVNGTGIAHGAEPGQPGVVNTFVQAAFPVNLSFITYPLPTAAFSYNDTCVNHATVFTNNSSVSNIQSTVIQNYYWYFGDGDSSHVANPTHIYTATGPHTVTLIVETNHGCRDTIQKTLTTLPADTFTVPVTICPNTSYVLPDGAIANTAGTYTSYVPSTTTCDSVIITILTVSNVVVTASNDTAICIGNAAQLSATGGLIYAWSPAASLNDSTLANPIATPTATTTYTVSSQVTLGNLMVNGNFSSGNTGFSSSYLYTPPPNTNEGQYWVGTNASVWNGGMASCGDHTTGTGNMLFVNGATSPNITVYCQTVNVQPNTDYAFGTWLMTLSAGNPAQLQFSINGNPIGSVFTASNSTCIWQQFYTVWNSGANTTANICILNQNTIASANDFALDDMLFAPLCTVSDTVVVTVHNEDSTIVNDTICQGNTYTFPNGSTSTVSTTNTSVLTNQYGCDSTVITNLTVNPTPTTVVNDTICKGVSYTLPNGTLVNTTGTYADTLVTVAGCDSIVNINLFVKPPPVTDVYDTICQGVTYTLPDGNVVNSTGNYSDTVSTLAGCDSIINTYLFVTPPPTGNVYDTICQGTTYTLPNGGIVNSTGNYTDTVSTLAGCDSAIITHLFVTPPPTGDVYDTICQGTTYTLPNGGIVNSTGNYTDTVSTLAGCDSAIITHLFVTPPPTGNVYDTICQGQNYTLPSGIVVTAAGNYTDTVATIAGCDSVVVTHLIVNPTSAVTINDTICTGSTYTLPDGTIVNTAGTYTSTFANQYGCDSVVTTNLTVITVTLTAQSTNALCNGDANGTVTATATGGVTPYTYTLSSGGNVIGSNTTGSFNSLIAANYTVDVTDNSGCTATSTTTVSEPAALTVQDDQVDVTCYGFSDGQIILTAAGGTGPYTYDVQGTTNTSGLFTQLVAGNYNYTVTDSNNCTVSGTVTITQPQQILLSINPDSATIKLSESLQLQATTNYDPNANYLWSPANLLSCVTCPNPSITTYQSVDLQVQVTVNINGVDCYAEADVPITVIPDYTIFIPNSFTPNADGLNDMFKLFGNIPAIKNIEVTVFNRIGEKVYQSFDAEFEWDGKYQGKYVDPGVYVYIVKATFLDNHTEKIFKGGLTIIR